MVWSDLVSYWTMLSLAIQSSFWERHMTAKLVQMGEATTRAAEWQTAAMSHQETAAAAEEQANLDEAEASTLETEGESLLEKSEFDSAAAAAKQVEVEGLEGDIVADEEETALHIAAAAASERIFEGEMADGTADAGAASRLESQARGEEVVIGFCEFVPLLDVACDVVGGISAVGLESGAAGEATKAASEFAAAVAAKTAEERESALSSELEAKAAADAALAGETQAQEAQVAELAESERAEGEADKVAAKEMYEKSAAEHETSVENEGEALSEQKQAEIAAKDVVSHGVEACWNAMLAGFFGLCAIVYFGFRMVIKFVVPSISRTFEFAGSFLSSNAGDDYQLHSLARRCSYLFLHVLTIFVLLATLGRKMLNLNATDIRARGGVIILVSIAAASTQILLLHVLPHGVIHGLGYLQIFDVLQRLVLMIIFICLELLVLQIGFTQIFLLPPLVSSKTTLLIAWTSFLGIVAAHIVYFDFGKKSLNEAQQSSSLEDEEQQNPSESDALLRINGKPMRRRSEPTKLSLKQELARMLIAFEILILVCLWVIIFHSSSSVVLVWAVAKPALTTIRPSLLVCASVLFCTVALGGICVRHCLRNRTRPPS